MTRNTQQHTHTHHLFWSDAFREMMQNSGNSDLIQTRAQSNYNLCLSSSPGLLCAPLSPSFYPCPCLYYLSINLTCLWLTDWLADLGLCRHQFPSLITLSRGGTKQKRPARKRTTSLASCRTENTTSCQMQRIIRISQTLIQR